MSDQERMDWLLANHCAPVLMNIKQANLVSIVRSRFQDDVQAIHSCSIKLGEHNIIVDVVKENTQTQLIFVYRPEWLRECFQDTDTREWLQNQGYAQSWNLDQCLFELKSRLRAYENKQRTFPHEIGVFLGYPLSDVIAYMSNQKRTDVSVGSWIAFSNTDAASKKFEAYRRAKSRLVSCFQQGKDIYSQIA